MRNVTLRQLRYFDALARHGHFGRAAEACAISQPALSMQIKEMEQALGGVLLERSARQLALTKLGEELLQRVRDILRSVDELGDFLVSILKKLDTPEIRVAEELALVNQYLQIQRRRFGKPLGRFGIIQRQPGKRDRERAN